VKTSTERLEYKGVGVGVRWGMMKVQKGIGANDDRMNLPENV
jgi:hypothetical protein